MVAKSKTTTKTKSKTKKARGGNSPFEPDFVDGGSPVVKVPVVPANKTVEEWLGLGMIGSTAFGWLLNWLDIGLTSESLGVVMSAVSIIGGAWVAIKNRWFNKFVTLESLPERQQRQVRRAISLTKAGL